ncbi:MAG: ATP-binding protein, partial [Gammaproteobacteria bacterium]|nr:ATP-binding protein [Gammaproteobacteria bacterium]
MDSTNIYAYIPFFTFLFTIVVTTYIQAKTRSSRLKDAYIYFSVALTFWIFWDLVLWLRIDEAWYINILKIQSIFWLPVGLLFLNFINAYLDRKHSMLVKLGMIVYVIAVGITLFTDYVIVGFRDVFWGVLHEAGPLHAVFSNIIVVIPMWYGIYLLLRSVRDRSHVRDQAASVMLLIGTILGASISYVTTVYFPDVLGRTDILPLHDVGIAVHSLFASIAVTRYRFLHIELADVAEDMFARMHDGVLVLDSTGKVQHANVSAREMLGLGFDELSDRKISKYFKGYPESIAFSSYELETSNINDESIYSVTQAPSVYGKRESGRLVVIRDISEQKKAEKEIRQMNRDLAQARDDALESSKLKSQFLANMSHELRTPLNAVIGYSEIIEEEAEELAQVQIASDADKINRAGKHLLTLINDILDLSKIEAGKMDVYIESFNLNELLQDVIITSQPMLSKNNNTFDYEIDNSVGLIESDQIKIRQILFNLVSNASKFTKDGIVKLESRVLVQVDQTQLQLKVSDTGIGMT